MPFVINQYSFTPQRMTINISLFWVWSSLLPITLRFEGLWSQGLISELINIGVCSIKAKADDIHRSHTIDLAIFREKVISNWNSYGLRMTLSCNQAHNKSESIWQLHASGWHRKVAGKIRLILVTVISLFCENKISLFFKKRDSRLLSQFRLSLRCY